MGRQWGEGCWCCRRPRRLGLGPTFLVPAAAAESESASSILARVRHPARVTAGPADAAFLNATPSAQTYLLVQHVFEPDTRCCMVLGRMCCILAPSTTAVVSPWRNIPISSQAAQGLFQAPALRLLPTQRCLRTAHRCSPPAPLLPRATSSTHHTALPPYAALPRYTKLGLLSPTRTCRKRQLRPSTSSRL